jgi:hypothetical protein
MTSVPGIGLRLLTALVIATAIGAPLPAGAFYDGGGKRPENDCLIGYDFVEPDQVVVDGKKQFFPCTDCDPNCDLDGVPTPNGSCTMAVGICINQPGDAACTPAAALDSASAKGKVKGVKGGSGKVVIDTSQLLQGSVCGAFPDGVLVPIKETNKGPKDGQFSFSLKASVKKNKTEGTPKRSDKNKLTYLCQPRPEGQACPVTTTSTTSTTSTTVEPTTTSTTSTTATTETVTTTSTSTSLPPTTSTTVVSTTVTTVETSTTTTSTTTTTVDPCGNNMIDGDEECDGSDFGGRTCESSPSGALLCNEDCTIDYSLCPGDSTTTSTSSSSTSSTVETTTTTVEPTTTTSSTVETTSTSTSTVTTTSTTTSLPSATILAFTTGDPVGTCGAVKSGGSAGTVRKALSCGGLNVGGGASTVAEGPTPANAQTQMNLSGGPVSYTVSARTAAQTGSNTNCSDTGCAFGPYLPISNSGTSTCVRNTFASPASGTLDASAGSFDGSFPLTSTVYLTANGTSPCPLCINGTPGVANSGICDPDWTSGVGASPDDGQPCTPVNAAGDTHDCDPPVAAVLPSFPVDLTPITTGTASDSDAGGIFCPGQTGSGAFGCDGGAAGSTGTICPGGTVPPLIDYIEEIGTPAGALSLSTPTTSTLASTFCIPSVGGSLGFLINGAANLPGPGATSLPGTLELIP